MSAMPATVFKSEQEALEALKLGKIKDNTPIRIAA